MRLVVRTVASMFKSPHRAFASVVALLLICYDLPSQAHIPEQYHSIHFHSGSPDFGIPPRRAVLNWRGEYDDRPLKDAYGIGDAKGGVLNEEQLDDAWETRDRARKEMHQRAAELVRKSRWTEARRAYEQVAREFRWTGSLRDRVEVLRQVEAMKPPLAPQFASALSFYLRGVALCEDEKLTEAQGVFQSVRANGSAGFLREHALYQLASLEYEWGHHPRAVALYQQLLREFPHRVKREAALIMIARCGLFPDDPKARRMEAGKKALEQLVRQFPQTRFRRSVLGLRARLHYLAKQYHKALPLYFALGDLPSVETVCREMHRQNKGKARRESGKVRVRLLAEYLRRLSNAGNFEEYRSAVDCIDSTRKLLSPTDAYRFSRLLLRQSDLAAPYIYYRLYHCDNDPADLANLARLADAVAGRDRSPYHSLPPMVEVRLAEVYYQRRQYGKALQWANRAMRPHPSDRALYVRGATLHKLKRYRAALADFNELIRRFPNSPLRHGGREELAILYEVVGDLGRALEFYFALGYRADIAFLLDARMTTREMEAFLSRHPRHPQLDLIAYSLGIRYLREERWRQSERWLKRIPRARYEKYSKGRREWAAKASPDPLIAGHDLEALQRAGAVARSTDEKAAALYRYASYYYTHGNLLLYNSALWQQERELAFDFWWNADHATRQDNTAARNHMHSHEVYARAKKICLMIARRYPHSPVAPQALYRAACCARWLANFNAWWSDENKRHDSWDESIHLMHEVARRYPHHPLAREARKFAEVFKKEKGGETRW
ncbi:MAG: tetratricopeptide repeat protein [Armatimonadetes bacterium]|nr:tetratricopeptide repeat protein [Armatimonadota bacterium]